MSILGRYLSVRYVSYVGLVLFALVSLALAFELLEKADQVLGAAPNGSETLVLFALLRLPELTIQMLPFACLLGTLITIMVLTRHSELIAIWGGGMSAFGMFVALLPVAIGIGALNLIVEDRLVPAAIEHLRSWNVGGFRVNESLADTSAVWVVSEPDIVRIPRSSGLAGTLSDISIFRREPDGSLIERLHAERAELDGTGWRLNNVEVTSATTAEVRRVDRMHWAGQIDIANLPLLSKEYPELTLSELYHLILNRGFGQRPVYLAETWVFQRLSGVLTPLLLVGLVVSMVQRRDRVGGFGRILLVSLAVGFAYFVLDRAALAMGESGLVPPWFAAFGIKTAMIGVIGAFLVRGEG